MFYALYLYISDMIPLGAKVYEHSGAGAGGFKVAWRVLWDIS